MPPVGLNLLPQIPFEKRSFFERVLVWTLQIFRHLLLFTQLLLFLIFIGQLVSNATLMSLEETLQEKLVLTKAFGGLEKDYRRQQTRIEIAGAFLKERGTLFPLLLGLAELTPPTLTLKELNLRKTTVLIQGESRDLPDLTRFKQSLLDQPWVKGGDLTQLRLSPAPIFFEIAIKIAAEEEL